MNVYSYARWSTKEQNTGDSERRQEAAAAAWCQRKGVTLSDRRFTDRGLSAKAGANREKGQLAALLDVARSGDVILIEDNDRFTREDPITALVQLREKVLDKGIRVVFLKTGVEVTRENFNEPAVLFPNFFQGFLANAENQKRAYRIKESWTARKQQIASGKAARHNYVCWLKWDETLKRPILDPEKAAVVQKIFKLASQGYGPLAIVRKLSEEKIPAITKRANGWNTNYVYKVLTDKTAIGYCMHTQPHQAGIYPPVVSEDVFYSVQPALKERKGATVPARSESTNLFTKLAVCSRCGSPLVVHGQKIPSGRKYLYLVCSGGEKGPTKCGMTSIRYDWFEASMMEILAALDKLRSQMAEKEGPSPVDVLAGKLKELEQQGEKLMAAMDSMKDEDVPRRVMARLKALENEENQTREALEAEKAKAKVDASGLTWAQFRKLVPEKLSDTDFRLKLKTGLRAVVESVTVDLKAKTFEARLKDYAEPITAELDGENLRYVVTTGKDKSLGCCCPLSARWKGLNKAA